MPENWKTYKLEDLGTIVTGKTPSSKHPEHFGDHLPFVTPTDFSEYHKNVTFASRYLSTEGVKHFKSKILPPGSVLVTCIGSQMGKVVVNKIEVLTNQQLNSIIPNKNADSDYLYYKLSSIHEQLRTMAGAGSTMPMLNKRDFGKIEVEIPEIQEQKSIASILSALDDKIELNLQMNKTLEEMAMALYKHWFGNFGPFQEGEFVNSELGEIPKEWEVKTLEDIIKFSNGYAFKSKQLLKEEEPDTFHIFKMGHILKGGGLKADGTKSWIKKSDCKGLDKFILKTGDILMSMTDMKDNMTILGHTALMNEDNKFIVNQRVGLLRVANNFGIDYPYVFLLTNSSDFIQRLRSQANSGVQVNLSTNAIKSAKVVIPNKEVNVKFNNIALPYYESINQNALENQTLTQLRDTLLPKLISGEVRVKDAEKTLSEVL